jgi:hypothetical protein
LQYLLKNTREYNNLIEQAKQRVDEVGEIDLVWANKFQSILRSQFDDPSFISIFDSDEWNRQSDLVNEFSNGTRKRLLREQELLRQLKN